jgi:hypothetical protein
VLKNLVGTNNLVWQMAKKKQKAKKPSTPPKTPRDDRVNRENGRLVGLGAAAVVLSVAVSFQPLSPFLLTAPVVKPLLRRLRAGNFGSATEALLRWALTVFLSILFCAVFVFDRTLSSFPFARSAAESAGQISAASGGVPGGYLFILAGLLVFVGLSAASLGIGACLLFSIAIGFSAGGAIALFADGTNLLLISLVALPPWQWAAFATALLLCVPAASIGAHRLFKMNIPEPETAWLKQRVVIAGGLVLLALICRLALAGPWLSVVRSWTVH